MEILTFGNNISGTLAEDITAEQTTIQLIQGQGQQFSDMLSTEFENPSIPLSYYSKLTLTNNKQSAREIVHLTSVDGDTLNVVRGMEGTTRRGWELNDFIGNMPTRGSENQFVQIGQEQAAFYLCGRAGGSANALTLKLPTNFFANGNDSWELNAPLIVYPTANNTGPATLQITLGNKTVGTYPLYKGERNDLEDGDILKGVPLLCLLNKQDGYVTVVNPSAIYDALGTAAFANLQVNNRDLTPGRVPTVLNVVGVNGGVARYSQGNGTVKDCNQLPINSVSFVYTDATNGPGFSGTLVDLAGLNSAYRVQIAINYAGKSRLKFRALDRDKSTTAWGEWVEVFSPNNVPTAAQVGAIPLAGSLGIKGDLRTTGVYQTTNANGIRMVYGQYGVIFRNDGGTFYILPTKAGAPYGDWSDRRPFRFDLKSGAVNIDNGLTVGSSLKVNGAAVATGNVSGNQLVPRNYSNFDARYLLKNAGVTTELVKGTRGRWKDKSTGFMIQWGMINPGWAGYSQVTFPIAFPNACINVQVSITGDGGKSAINFSSVKSGTITKSGAQIGYDKGGSYWLAMGY